MHLVLKDDLRTAHYISFLFVATNISPVEWFALVVSLASRWCQY